MEQSGYTEYMEMWDNWKGVDAFESGYSLGEGLEGLFNDFTNLSLDLSASDISGGFNLSDILTDIDGLGNTVGTDGTGGAALKTTSKDDLSLKDEDIQLLLDVATRDYKLNYQKVEPNITITFGDVRETADVDNILDKVADKLEEIYDSNLEVANG